MAQGKYVVVQTAPAVRAAIAEEFGKKIGEENGEGKMVAALHRLGFNRVFDVNFGADLTITEEAQELVNRIAKKVGSAPADHERARQAGSTTWNSSIAISFPHVSTCKSPHEMQGAITKSYFAEKHGLRSEERLRGLRSCRAPRRNTKKSVRRMRRWRHLPDVDAVFTTRELAVMIKRAGLLVWDELPAREVRR
jgi:NADP-reducing hydrogenase subunit HndD